MFKTRYLKTAIWVSIFLFYQLMPAGAENLAAPKATTISKPLGSTPEADTQLVYDVVVKMLDRWNARDIDGLMTVYWNSPGLLAVIDTEQLEGWENLYRSYKTQYSNPNSMGIVNPTRVQVKLLKPDLAFGVVSWTMRFPGNARASEVVGTTTMDIQKFDTGWKIVVLHSSFAEM
jgi:hypothetical protein